MEKKFAKEEKVETVLDAIRYEIDMEGEEQNVKKLDEVRDIIEQTAKKVDVNYFETELLTDLKASARQMVENVRAAIAIRRAVEKLEDERLIEPEIAARIGAEAEELIKRNLKWAGEQHAMAEALINYGLKLHGGTVNYLHVLAVPLAFMVAIRILK